MARTFAATALVLAGCFGGPGGGSDDTGLGDTDVGAPGGLDSIWQAERVEIQVLDPNDPFGVTERSLTAPVATEIPEGRGRARTLVSIEDDQLVHWVWVEGESVHWRIVEPVVGADGSWVAADRDGSRVISLVDGHLEIAATWMAGDLITYTTTTYGALDVLPGDWPTERRDGVREVTP